MSASLTVAQAGVLPCGRALSLSKRIRRLRHWPRLCGLAWTPLLLVGMGVGVSFAAEPRIDRIEPLPPNRVTIHFGTQANRTTYLQTYRVSSGQWSNLFTAPKLPVTNHYIIPDYRTNEAGLYRLKVVP